MSTAPEALAVLGLLALAACTAKAPDAKPSPSAAAGLANGSFTAELNGFRIHYEVHGRGPVLMALTNSWGLSHEALRSMYRPLEEKLTLVYFDPRGMGGSGPVREESDRGLAAVRADFQALRAHLKLERTNAIGWSNGAINLMWLAHEHPETLSSAIFVHGQASLGPEDMKAMQEQHPDLTRKYGALMAAVSKPGLSAAEQTALQRKMWLEDYFPSLCADPVKGRGLVAEVFRDAQLSWPHAEHTNKEAPTFDARKELAAIPVRSLVIAGAHDMLPPSRVRELADGLPHSQFVVFGKSGHFSPVEEPEGFKAAVYAFLDVGGGTPAPAGR
jgi:pimeloyl-ACP methyl ester carboxylesterase